MSGFRNETLAAENYDFRGVPLVAPQVNSAGQLPIGTGGSPAIEVGLITSTSLTVGYSSPNITIEAGSSVATTYQADSGSAAPALNILNVLGGTGIDTSGIANTLTIAVDGSVVGQTITGDSGGALSPTLGNFNIFGLSGSKTSGSGSTLTIKSPPYADFPATATAAVNTGSFITAGGNIILDLPSSAADGDLVEVVCTTANLVAIDASATHFIRIGTLITSVGGTATSTQIGDAVCLRFHLATLTWYATSVIGTFVMA